MPARRWRELEIRGSHNLVGNPHVMPFLLPRRSAAALRGKLPGSLAELVNRCQCFVFALRCFHFAFRRRLHILIHVFVLFRLFVFI